MNCIAGPAPAHLQKLAAVNGEWPDPVGPAVDDFCTDKSQHQLKRFADYLLRKVFIVFVKTHSWQSAYRLFNVLNARGMSLSNADLIKNTLFSMLGAQANRSTELEDRCWRK